MKNFIILMLLMSSLSWSQIVTPNGVFYKEDIKTLSQEKIIFSKEKELPEFNFNGKKLGRVYMGEWDFNGDGKLQKAYNCDSKRMEIMLPDGNYQSIEVFDGRDWKFYKTAETDGLPGLENIYYGGSHIKIYSPANGAQRYYQISTGVWAFLTGGIEDFDGRSGMDIACITSNGIKIIYDARYHMFNFQISKRSFILLSNSIQELDGHVGMELAFNVSGDIVVIIPRLGIGGKRNYVIGHNWTLLGYEDIMQNSGKEILFDRKGICVEKNLVFNR